jgi:group II intron reverse transcriptase/maturase
MRNAETVLSVIRERGRQGLPLERVYRLLFNDALFLVAYGRIASNRGALTTGATSETADGMTRAKIDAIIEALRFERYRWTPARRTYIPKSNGKRRPLGIPTWSDKLLQEVLRLILDAYYEPQFSGHSHGFRAGRGCHSALVDVRTWTGTTWLIEGDIAQCFDRLDHEVLLEILAKQVHDGRFLRLIRDLLQSGYLENWRFNATLSGTPQGGVVSPLLANVYLDRLDRFVEQTLIPAYTRGEQRSRNSAHRHIQRRMYRLDRQGHRREAHRMRLAMQQLPYGDPNDPGYRRLRYVRYADDFLLGFIGPRAEAEAIKSQLDLFLRETLKLELSEEKTLITHARSSAARFLGYEVIVKHNNHRLDHRGLRSLNGTIGLRVPMDVIRGKCATYMQHGKPVGKWVMRNDSAFSIVAQYQSILRGVVAYYQLADNVGWLARLKWVMETSLTKTLAAKLRIRVHQVYRRFGTTIATPTGPQKRLQVVVERGEGKPPLVAHWGGISLAREKHVVLNDEPPRVWNTRTELLERFLAETCELCGSKEQIEVHHVRALKDLQRKGQGPRPQWVRLMAARQRKTLVVCRQCHMDIQHGRSRRSHMAHSTSPGLR